VSYNPRSKGSNYGKTARHRHGTFKLRTEKGKQWIGGNQFVNAENDYGKPKTEETKEPEKLPEPKPIQPSLQQRVSHA